MEKDSSRTSLFGLCQVLQEIAKAHRHRFGLLKSEYMKITKDANESSLETNMRNNIPKFKIIKLVVNMETIDFSIGNHISNHSSFIGI